MRVCRDYIYMVRGLMNHYEVSTKHTRGLDASNVRLYYCDVFLDMSYTLGLVTIL